MNHLLALFHRGNRNINLVIVLFILTMIISALFSPWEIEVDGETLGLLDFVDPSQSFPVKAAAAVLFYGVFDIYQLIVYAMFGPFGSSELVFVFFCIILLFVSVEKHITDWLIEERFYLRNHILELFVSFLLENVVFYWGALVLFYAVPPIYRLLAKSEFSVFLFYGVGFLLIMAMAPGLLYMSCYTVGMMLGLSGIIFLYQQWHLPAVLSFPIFFLLAGIMAVLLDIGAVWLMNLTEERLRMQFGVLDALYSWIEDISLQI